MSVSKLIMVAALSLWLAAPAGATITRVGPDPSDAALSEAITEKIMAQWRREPYGLIVIAEDGAVELWGEAPSAAAAAQAEALARQTAGVENVANFLNIAERQQAAAPQATQPAAGAPPQPTVSAQAPTERAQ